jgi:periplasmic divalent cation tolerance protein
MTPIRVVLCTAPPEISTDLARRLVEERLVACVNILPGIRSVYRWQGAVQEDSEHLLVMKTAAERADALVVRIRELHPYQVPEVLCLPVDAGSGPYLDWVLDATRA